jgi:hypothetical protein
MSRNHFLSSAIVERCFPIVEIEEGPTFPSGWFGSGDEKVMRWTHGFERICRRTRSPISSPIVDLNS